MRALRQREWAWLGVALLLLLAAAWYGNGSEDDSASVALVQPGKGLRTKDAARQEPDLSELDVSSLRRAPGNADSSNLFASGTWVVAPAAVAAPVAKPLPPPAPMAPALPFTYLGRYPDLAKPVIVLMRGDRLLLVSTGDVIEGTYRVETLGANSLGLTYLPLNIRQNLEIGAAE